MRDSSQTEVSKGGWWIIWQITPHSMLFSILMNFAFGFVGQSTPVPRDASSRHHNCNEVCSYDDWFHRVQCEERDLYQVPFSTGCTDATMLEVQENKIARLTVECLSGYNKLRTLDVSQNTITVIEPGTFLCVPRLRNLLASHNYLNELQNGTFTGPAYHLERIYLSHNKLRYIDEDALKNLLHVVLLHLAYNKIETLHPQVFLGMSNLRYLYLGKNRLRFIYQSAFHNLNSLELIDLSENKLGWIPDGLFDDLASLREVILSGNDITSLPVPTGYVSYELFDVANNNLNQSGDVVPYLHISDKIYIDDNPFLCDCDFLLLQQWYRNKTEFERQHYEIRNHIMCEDYSINEDIPVSCDPINFPDTTTERSISTTHSTIHVVDNISRNERTKVSIEAGTNVKPKKDFNIQGTAIDCVEVSDKNVKMFALLIYIAVILTVFLLLWVLKTCIL